MNTLTSENLTAIIMQIAPGVWPEITFAYIRTLTTPYFEVMDTVTDVESLKAWLTQAFKRDLSAHAIADINTALDELPQPLPADHVRTAINAAADCLLFDLVERTWAAAAIWQSYQVLPWDVQYAIAADPAFSEMFGITSDQSTLPVEVTFGASTFTHMLNLEFFGGLLLFSTPWFSGQPLNLSMFGTTVPTDYFQHPEAATHFDVGDGTLRIFALELPGSETVWRFNTMDFLQGLLTGSEWLNFDHNTVKYKLTLYDDLEDDNGLHEGKHIAF